MFAHENKESMVGRKIYKYTSSRDGNTSFTPCKRKQGNGKQ